MTVIYCHNCASGRLQGGQVYCSHDNSWHDKYDTCTWEGKALKGSANGKWGHPGGGVIGSFSDPDKNKRGV